MAAKRARIIKSHEIEITGTVLLEVDSTTTDLSGTDRHDDSPAQVRVVEQHDDRAVLEVTCGCGRTVRIRCDYANAPVS